jgi:hypothetical protein
MSTSNDVLEGFSSDAPPIYGEMAPPPKPAPETEAGSATPHIDSRSNAESLTGSTATLLVPIPNSTQLIYMRLKARNSRSSGSYKYADTSALKQVLLPFLAQIPLLKETNLFRSGKLLFLLFKHSSAEKGFFYTASFLITDSQESELSPLPHIPSLILQAQQQHPFSLDLPIVLHGKETSTLPSSCVFAMNKEELSTMTSIDFQVKVPPVCTRSPANEFAQLLCNIITPRMAEQSISEYQAFISSDQERFASFCKPRKINLSDHGDFMEEIMHGTFLLNLDDVEARDIFILHRIIFATFFGLDPRFGAHQQFVLSVSLFNDVFQLGRKPAIIQQLVDSMKFDKRFTALMPAKLKRVRASRQSASLSQSSDTESEEGYTSRLSKRAEALTLLPSAESEYLQDFPSLRNLKFTPTASITPVLQQTPKQAEPTKVTADDLRNILPAPDANALKAQQQEHLPITCQPASSTANDMRTAPAADALKTQQKEQRPTTKDQRPTTAAPGKPILNNANDASRVQFPSVRNAQNAERLQNQQREMQTNKAPPVKPLPTDNAAPRQPVQKHQQDKRFPPKEAPLPIQPQRGANAQRGQSHPQRGQSRAEAKAASPTRQHANTSELCFTQQIRDSFPSLIACASATVQSTGPDGNCLFHAFLAATAGFKIGLKPNITVADLRHMLIQFLKVNRYNNILPAAAFVNQPLVPSSPESLMNMMRPFRLVPHKERPAVLVPCSCPRPEREHDCDGIPAGQLKIHDVVEPLYFKNLDEYLLIMKNNGAYGEDLEIAALSARFEVSICVYVKQPQIINPQTRTRSDILDDNIQIFYHPKSKGTVCLVSYSGRVHYEWLSFANVTQPPEKPTSKDIEIIEIPATPLEENDVQPHALPGDQRFSDWFDVHILEFKQSSAEIVFIRDRYDWPPESNSLHAATFLQLERNLYHPCNPYVHHTCCSNSLGDCLCCAESECSWEISFDPWAHVPLNPLAYDRMSNSVLTLVSKDFFRDAPKGTFLLQCFYLFSRMAIFLHSINLQRLFKMKQQTEGDLEIIRTALQKFIDSLRLIDGYAKRDSFLSTTELGNLSTQRTTLDVKYRASLEVTELFLTTLSLNAKTQSQANLGVEAAQNDGDVEHATPPKVSSQASISDSLKAIDILYNALTADAENSVELSKARLASAIPENALIAALQIKKLSEDLAAAHTKMLADSETLRNKQALKFSMLFGDYAKRIASAQAIIAEIAISTKELSRLPPTISAEDTPKKKQVKQLPFTSPRTANQQQTIVAFLSKVSAKVGFLQQINVGDGIATPAKVPITDSPSLSKSTSPLSSTSSLNAEDDDQQLQERLIEKRAEAGSARSVFETEAHNVQSHGNDDSHETNPSHDSTNTSDRDFLGSSQEIEESRHPRVLHIRTNIKEATASLRTKSDAKAPKIPTGWCNWGHLIRVAASFSRGKAIKCNACHLEFKQDMYSCRCFRYYACISCLTLGKTHPKPPECPDLSCTGSCSLQHKAVAVKCYQGDHKIPANENAWYCQAESCRAVLCVSCNMQAVNFRQQPQPADDIADTLQPEAFDQLRFPPTATTSHPSSPNPFPLSSPPRQNSSSSAQKGQVTPMSHDRA